MNRSSHPNRQLRRPSHRTSVRMDIEALDCRVMMSATPPSELAAAPTTNLVEAFDENILALTHEADTAVSAGMDGGSAMPNPEDDDGGGWGPIGPWVHEGLTNMAEQFADRFSQEVPMTMMGGGNTGQPSPDDDGPWPPGIGPLIKTADDLYLVAARDTLKVMTAEANPEPQPWKPAEFHRVMLQQLSRYTEPDPEPWIDWSAIAESAHGLGLPDGGYPAPDDDGGWGPADPVVQDGLKFIAEDFANRLGEQMEFIAMQGGSMGQPSPDDDGPWPPGIGPLIKTTNDLYILVAVDAIRDTDGIMNPESASSPFENMHRILLSHQQLFDRTDVLIRELFIPDDSNDPPRIEIVRQVFGDSNHDGIFDSSDLVLVLASGKYEDGIVDNATFEEGDWNYDGDFDSSDFVFALSLGHYGVDPDDADDPSDETSRDKTVLLR